MFLNDLLPFRNSGHIDPEDWLLTGLRLSYKCEGDLAIHVLINEPDALDR
jgi:hypothetical protein